MVKGRSFMNLLCRGRWLAFAVMMIPAMAAAAPADVFEKAMEPNRFAPPPGISMEQAADMVRRDTGGRVLSATPTERGDRRGYEIRVLLDGKRVKKVFVDSQTKPPRQ
jgi:uncharacterized membrane protein YkoI